MERSWLYPNACLYVCGYCPRTIWHVRWCAWHALYMDHAW
jgi:hypothetical protein